MSLSHSHHLEDQACSAHCVEDVLRRDLFKVCVRVEAGHCHEAGLVVYPREAESRAVFKEGRGRLRSHYFPGALLLKDWKLKGTATENDRSKDLQSVRPCWLFCVRRDGN